MFSGISVAMLQGKTGYLVVLFSPLRPGSILLTLSMGCMDVPILDIINLFLGNPLSHTEISPVTETFETVLLDIRLPRILTCAAVGAAFTTVFFSGTALMAHFDNPLLTFHPNVGVLMKQDKGFWVDVSHETHMGMADSSRFT
jgi:ABC-type Fe3+-siderophore transport system permease subunit